MGACLKQLFVFTLITLGSPVALWAQTSSGQITLSLEEYNQMLSQTQGGAGNCIGNLAQSMSQSATASYQAHNQRTNALMQAATTRFETLKNCRQELQESWLQLEQARLEHQQNVNQREAKIRRAEIAYKSAVLEAERTCRQQANDEFAAYREQVYGQRVIHDPTMLPGFNQQINSANRSFFQNCQRDPTNTSLVRLHGEEYQAAILEIETEIRNSADRLSSMETQLSRIQANSLQNCEDQQELNAYNEALSLQQAQRALSLARMQAALGSFQAMMGCIDPGTRTPTGGNTDSTTSSQQSGQRH